MEFRRVLFRSVFSEYFLRYLTNDIEQLEQQSIITLFQRQQRGYMPFWNHDDVNRPEWTRVMIGKNVVSFANHSDCGSPAQYFIAIEVFSHRRSILRRSVLFFGTQGGVASDTAQ